MFFSVLLWLNKTVLCISSWGFLSFAVAGFPKCLSWKMEPLVLTKRFNSNTGELKSGSRTGSRFMAWVCSCWASSRMTFNSFKNFILKVLVLTFLWEHHCSISSEQLLLLTGSGWAQSGLCSPDLQTPNALDYFTLLQGTEMVTGEGTEAVLSQESLHSPGPAEQRPRGFCSPLFNSFMPNELNVHLIFPGNNAFFKKQTVLSSCLFQLSLQLFSTAFTNYFKSFLGIHSPQSRLAVAQTKKLRKKKKKSAVKK